MIPAQHTQWWDDIGFYVSAVPDEYHVHYTIYRTLASQEVIPYFERATPSQSIDWTPDSAHAAIFAHGDVKWDGCSNWHFDAQETVMIHACSRKSLQDIGAMLTRCWEWTAQLCPQWEGGNL